MSSALWTNMLHGGIVTSDNIDKFAIYQHSKKLDKICLALGLRTLSSLHDTTDLKCNLDLIELPDEMESTDELMAVQGFWIDADEAVKVLEQLHMNVVEKKVRFGLFDDDHEHVVAELFESLLFAKIAAKKKAKFNFSVVM